MGDHIPMGIWAEVIGLKVVNSKNKKIKGRHEAGRELCGIRETGKVGGR